MELGKQIKKYRNELSLSQEALAEKIYVTRQTVSNWENEKNYPDINSLVLLSEVFGTSVDNLIKGDVQKMKEQINEEDQKNFARLGNILTVLFILTIVSPVPLWHFLGITGGIIWAVLWGVMMYFAYLCEKKKKQLNIHTYREIVAFTEGKQLDEITKERENAKRPYQQILLAIGSALLTFAVLVVMLLIFKVIPHN